MGLGKKHKANNTRTQQAVSQAQQPLAVGGYNAENVQSLPKPVMTQDDYTDIMEMKQEMSRTPDAMVAQVGSLRKPNVPPGAEINSIIVDKLWKIINKKKLHAFYTQDRLQRIVDRVCKHDYLLLMKEWGIPSIDMASDLSLLGLYDIVLHADDSYSMTQKEPKEDNMTRWQLLQVIAKTIVFWSTLMDDDGISLRFFNSQHEEDCITSFAKVEEIFSGVAPNNGTPMGTSMMNKVIKELLEPLMQCGVLEKPVLLITMTDGIPNNKQDVTNAVHYGKSLTAPGGIGQKYGEYSIVYSFSQIGTDASATGWLGEIDQDKAIGHLIDCTSNYEIESKECMQKYGCAMPESAWLIKLLVGCIDPEYDQADEGAPVQPG